MLQCLRWELAQHVNVQCFVGWVTQRTLTTVFFEVRGFAEQDLPHHPMSDSRYELDDIDILNCLEQSGACLSLPKGGRGSMIL
jgi:hypothetical protein